MGSTVGHPSVLRGTRGAETEGLCRDPVEVGAIFQQNTANYRFGLRARRWTEVPGAIWRNPKGAPKCLGSQQCAIPGRDEALVCHVAFRSLPQTTVSVMSRIGA